MRKFHHAVLLSLTALFCLFSTAFATAQIAQTITFPAITGTQYALTSLTLSATASSGLTVAFASVSPTICTVSGTTASLLTPGACVIHATQAGNATYSVAPMVAVAFAVSKATQTITFPTVTGTQYALSSLSLSATASSGLAVTLTSASTAVCTISGTTATLLTQGTCIVKANQAGSTLYSYAPTVQQLIAVHLAPQTISFPVPAGTQYALTSVPLTATASSGLPITYTSLTPTYCTVTGSTAYPLQQGSCFIHAQQAGNNVYSVSPLVTQFFGIHLALQTITFPAIAGTQYVLGTTTLSATASSGLTVAFASATPAVCTVSGTTATFKTTGDCVIHATQAGNKTVYAVAQLVSQSIIVHAIPQTITFPAITATLTAATTLPLSATASSGLTVAFASATPAVCTVSGTTASLLTSGTCTLQATQAGNANYAAATLVQQNVSVHLASQTITFPAIAAQVVGANVTLGATASSGLAVTYTSVTTAVCTVSGSTATMAGAGACVIHATQPGNATYGPAALVSKSFTVTLGLSITSSSSLPQGTVGTAYSQQLSASGGTGTYTWSTNTAGITSLAAVGLSLSSSGLVSNGSTALIAGTATFAAQVKDSSSTIATQQFTVSVYYPFTLPASGPLGAGEVGHGYKDLITAIGGTGSGYAFSVNVAGTIISVPTTNSWVSIADNIWVENNGSNTLTVAGTPSATGTVTIAVTVTDSLSHQASGTYTIAIGSTPVGFTVTGTVSYSGTASGWVYLSLGGCSTCTGTYGTAVQSPGAFTIRGVPPGTYTLNAWMDSLGTGAQNASNPIGSQGVVVINTPLTSASVMLYDPSTVTVDAEPALDNLQGYGVFSGGAFISFDPILNSSNIEVPTSYTLQWSTDSTFETGVASKSFAAISGDRTNNTPLTGGRDPWVVTGLTNGSTYYFRAAGVAGGVTGPWSTVSSGMTINAPSAGFAVSGSVTIPSTITPTGPLYVGFWDQSAGGIYATKIASPSNSAANSYTVNVPAGSNYFLFAFLDQNNSGLMGSLGQVSNTNGYNMVVPSVKISAATTGQNLTLPSANSSVRIVSEVNDGDGYSGTSSTLSYGIDLLVSAGNKIPVAVTLLANANIAYTQDIAENLGNGFNPNDRFYLQIEINASTAPTVGAVYSVQVTYSDGKSETLNPTITALLPSLNSLDLSPVGPVTASNSLSLAPTFGWQYSANPGNYLYQLWVADEMNYATTWSIPYLNSASNAFTSSISSIAWGSDPTDADNLPTLTGLVGGHTYWWQIVAYDSNGNRAQAGGSYSPGYTALALPAANPSSLGPAILYQPYSGSITATGGYAGFYGHIYSINGTNNFWSDSPYSLGNGLFIPNTANSTGSLHVFGTPTATGLVSFQVYAEDSTGTIVGPITYTINIAPYANVSLPSPSKVNETAIVGIPFGTAINASGGPGGGNYAWTVNGVTLTPNNNPYVFTALSNGDGLTVATSGGNTLWFAGTPTAANSGISIVVTVTDMDNTSDTATATYTLPVVAGPNGANNKYLSGTYVCKLDGYFDQDGSRWTTLASFKAGGATGVISSGKYDINGREFTSGEQPGTFTGSYSVAADNNGLMTVNTSYTENGTAKTGTLEYAIALNDANQATTTATEFRMGEIDTNLQHGSGVCYQANTAVFGTDIFAGNSFVFMLNGENGSGQPEAILGRFYNASGTAAGILTGGVADDANITDQSETEITLTGGTYTIPDATNGRSTITFTVPGSTPTLEAYVIDANRMFMIETDDAKAQSADVRKQLVTSYTGNATGSYVTYEQGYMLDGDYTYTYYSMIVQASSSGSNVATVNQMYQDNNGSYKAGGSDIGSTSTTTFDQTAGNAGRATIAVSGSTDTMIAYYYNTGSAFQLDYNGNDNYLATGWTEPQTQTTFTDAAVAGKYLLGSMQRMQAVQDDTAGEFNMLSSGSISTNLTEADEGVFIWDQPATWTYSWDTTVPGTGSFLVAGTGDTGGDSCMVINSTKLVCTPNADSWPGIAIIEQ
jgi:hypothetical protein